VKQSGYSVGGIKICTGQVLDFKSLISLADGVLETNLEFDEYTYFWA
jgi:hypothetical protein